MENAEFLKRQMEEKKPKGKGKMSLNEILLNKQLLKEVESKKIDE
jgi:hypothetical protein